MRTTSADRHKLTDSFEVFLQARCHLLITIVAPGLIKIMAGISVYVPEHLPIVVVIIFANCAVLTGVAGAINERVMRGPCKEDTKQAIGSEGNPVACELQDSDVLLGGLFMFHNYDDATAMCPTSGANPSMVRYAEIMRHAVDLVNKDGSLLPGLTLGYEIRDTCGSESYTLQQCVAFLNPSRVNECVTSETGRYRSTVVGVLGPTTSANTIQATNFLGLFRRPLIGCSATSPQLSNNFQYPHFLRTIPSDEVTVDVIRRIAESLDWVYLGLVYSDDAFGRGGARFIKMAFNLTQLVCSHGTAALRNSQCLAFERSIPNQALSNGTVAILHDIWEDILYREPQRLANVVILFTGAEDTTNLLAYPATTGGKLYVDALRKNTTFIGTEASTVRRILKNNIALSKGMISPVPARGKSVPSFMEHWINVNPLKDAGNPWLMEVFQCPGGGSQNCTRNMDLDVSIDFYDMYIFDAVFAFAHALHNIYEKCNRRISCMLSTASMELTAALKAVNFTLDTGRRVAFAPNGDSLTSRYDTLNAQEDKDGNINIVQVGSFGSSPDMSLIANPDGRENTRSLINRSLVKWNSGYSLVPTSFCSPPCPAGMMRDAIVRRSNSSSCQQCCWLCAPCELNTYADRENSDICSECNRKERSESSHVRCIGLPTEQLIAPNGLAIFLLALALVGILACAWAYARCLLVGRGCFYLYGQEPTFLCLLGILLASLSVLPLLSRPSNITCSVTSSLSILGISIIVSNLLIYSLYRFAVQHQISYAKLLLHSKNRAVTSAVLVVCFASLFAMVGSLAGFPSVVETVIAHTSVTKVCQYNPVHIVCLACILAPDAAAAFLALRTRWVVSCSRQWAVYKMDPKCTHLLAVGASCGLTTIMAIFLSAVWIGGNSNNMLSHAMPHFTSLVFSLTFFAALLQPIRKLAPLDEEQAAWYEEYSLALVSSSKTTSAASGSMAKSGSRRMMEAPSDEYPKSQLGNASSCDIIPPTTDRNNGPGDILPIDAVVQIVLWPCNDGAGGETAKPVAMSADAAVSATNTPCEQYNYSVTFPGAEDQNDMKQTQL